MKAWLLVALPGGSIIVVGYLLYQLWTRARDRQQGIDAELETLINAKGVRVSEILRPKDGEVLRDLAARRRDHANAKRRQAAQIESGAESSERLRLVR